VVISPPHPSSASVLLGKARRFPPGALDGLRRREPAVALFLHSLQRRTRQCIGDNFSRLESVLLLATFAQRFQPVPPRAQLPKPEFLVLARPAGGVPMILHRRAQRTDHGRAWA
jgi:hypothetical protein